MAEAAFRLDGRVALVTGASTGLGAGVAVALARQGADVAIAGRSIAGLEKTAAQIAPLGRQVLPLVLDVRDDGQRREGVAAVQRQFGGLDILVNNAGINRPMPGLQVTEENWDDTYATNVKGGFFLAQLAAPLMIEKGWGRVIWMASQSGLVGIPGQPVYCSSKGAVIQLVRTLGLEWAKHGITVNAVAPTFVETNLTHARLQQPEFRAFVLGKIPAGRLATVEEVAACVVFLASEEAAMVNCHALSVDGGWTAW
jgi:NAD(P)-dependent dehydrogenase (short-subunit alcohol dehydrogenase family)